MWWVNRKDYDVAVMQYQDMVKAHNEVSKRHNEIVDKLQNVMTYLIDIEKQLSKEQTLRERLELDLAASQSEYRKVVDTLGSLAKRPTLDTVQAISDLFAEDPKQPTVWLTDDTVIPEDILEKMKESAVG